MRTCSRTALDYGVRENIKLRKINSTVAQVHAINTLLNSVKVIYATKVLFKIVAVLLVWQSQVLQGQGPVWPRPRTFAQGQGQGLNPQRQGQGQGLDLQGQSQGLKICPRGHLKTKDQGQGQQHWDLLRGNWCNGFWPLALYIITHSPIDNNCCVLLRDSQL